MWESPTVNSYFRHLELLQGIKSTCLRLQN